MLRTHCSKNSLNDFDAQVKKILIPQRENPVVNRLNKTKVERFPDLHADKEDKLKALRKKEQAAKLDRVRNRSVWDTILNLLMVS